MTASKQIVDMWTDGACEPNPGHGGWAAILRAHGEKEQVLRGRVPNTTNNRMEMLAVIEALESLSGAYSVTVYSDSQYVVNTMTRGWKRKKNVDLWDRLDLAVGRHDVRWVWVRGHSGHEMNEWADRLAEEEAQQGVVYGEEYPYEGDPLDQLQTRIDLGVIN